MNKYLFKQRSVVNPVIPRKIAKFSKIFAINKSFHFIAGKRTFMKTFLFANFILFV